MNNWFGLFAPSGMASAQVKTVHAAAVKALSTPELQQKLIEGGGIPSPGAPEEFRALIVADSQTFARIIMTWAFRWKVERARESICISFLRVASCLCRKQ